MTDKTIDLNLPRELYYRSIKDKAQPCPRCGTTLVQQNATYLVETYSNGDKRDSLMMHNDMDWFCEFCPVAVIDTDKLDEFLGYQLPYWEIGDDCSVVGLVDLDAIPKNKQNIPLGDDDNPIPLVEFYAPETSNKPAAPAIIPPITPSERQERKKKLEKTRGKRRKKKP